MADVGGWPPEEQERERGRIQPWSPLDANICIYIVNAKSPEALHQLRSYRLGGGNGLCRMKAIDMLIAAQVSSQKARLVTNSINEFIRVKSPYPPVGNNA